MQSLVHFLSHVGLSELFLHHDTNGTVSYDYPPQNKIAQTAFDYKLQNPYCSMLTFLCR